MKKILLALIVILSLAAAGAWFHVHQVGSRFKSYLAALETLEAGAGAANAKARQLSASGRYDLEITLQRRLIEELLGELRGFVNISSRGSRLEIQTIEPRFHEGFLSVEAQALLDSPYYSGPVAVTYFAFAALADDGRCRLEFRAVSASVKQGWLRGQTWLEPFLVFRLQRKLKIPELTLPFGIERQLTLPRMQKSVSRKRFDLDIPGREIHVTLENPRILVTPETLGVLVERVRFDDRAPAQEPERAPLPRADPAPGGDLRVSLRLQVLTRLMTTLLAPDRDVFIAADQVPDAYHRQKKVVGIKFDNHADLHQVSGYVDLTGGALSTAKQLVYIDLGVKSQIEGQVSGKAFGIPFARPFQVTSQLADKVPISLTYEDDALVMTVDDQPLVLEMKVRLPVGSHHLTIPYKLDLTSKELLRPVVLPRWLHKTVAVPTRVERKKIVATRPADLALTWHLDLPPENGDFLTITGNLTQKPAVTPH